MAGVLWVMWEDEVAVRMCAAGLLPRTGTARGPYVLRATLC